jgi:lysophospholipase L1-like esterase
MPRERRSKYANDAKDTAGIASQVESLSSSLAQRPTKTEARLKADKIQLEDMSETTLGAMSGNAAFNLLSVPQDKSVTPEKTTFFDVDYSLLYDYTKAVNGYINPTNGVIVNGGTSYTSDLMPIRLDENYVTNSYGAGIEQVYMYDTSANYIGYFSLSSEQFSIDSTTHPTCRYIRLSWATELYQTGMLVEGTVLPETYTPYARYSLAITDETIIESLNQVISVTPEKMPFFTIDNTILYDYTKSVIGYFSLGVLQPYGDSYTSDFIPISLDKTYASNVYTEPINTVYLFASDLNYIGEINVTTEQFLINSTIYPTCQYIRLTFQNTTYQSGMLVEGNTLPEDNTPYSKQHMTINDNYVKQAINAVVPKLPKGRWEEKKANFLGDSITQGFGLNPNSDNYTKTVKELLGLKTLNNYGYSGTFISATTGGTNTFIDRYSSMDNTAELVVVFGGINDYRGNVPLGTISDTTDISFYGALRVLMIGIITNNPTATVIFLTPMQDNSEVFNIDYVNSAGFKLKDYVKAVKDVAEIYAVPVLDMYRESGINVLTASAWTQEGLHPNKAGAVKIGTQIAGFLKSI